MPRNRDPLHDEEAIGTDGIRGLQWRVQASGRVKKTERSGSVDGAPGSVIRVAIGPSNGKRQGVRQVARILAFIDPLNGKLVVRMGMWNVSRSTKGYEEGPQVVWESDTPIVKVDND